MKLPLHICPHICWSSGSCISSSAREILSWADMIGGKAIYKQLGKITVWEHEVLYDHEGMRFHVG